MIFIPYCKVQIVFIEMLIYLQVSDSAKIVPHNVSDLYQFQNKAWRGSRESLHSGGESEFDSTISPHDIHQVRYHLLSNRA